MLCWVFYSEVVTDGLMPIHLAVHYNKPLILRWMTTRVEDIDIESKNGYSALQLAAQKGYVHCMEVCIVK